MKAKFTFLILHYMTIDETVNCINSIISFCNNIDYSIVVVDNNSTNNTFLDLLNKYENNDNIYILKSDENLGFSNGNNIGFKFAKEKLNPDFIVMINNDTKLVDNSFCSLVIEEYEKSDFAVLGPRIILKDGSLTKYPFKPFDIKYVKNKIKKLKTKRLLLKLHMFFIHNIYLKLKKEHKESDELYLKRHENIVLQGAALIFSKKYIDKFDGLDTRTFLYNEEQLLYWRLCDNNLKSVYNPNIIIYHNENSTTDYINSKKREKNLFVIKNELDSTIILYNDLQKRKEMEK